MIVRAIKLREPIAYYLSVEYDRYKREIERPQRQQGPIDQLTRLDFMHQLSHNDWDILEKYGRFLYPMKVRTKVLEGRPNEGRFRL